MDSTDRAELARLRAAVAALQAEMVASRRRRRVARRVLPLCFLAILAVFAPLSLLAAAPFGDLNPGSPHNDNIAAIADAGITKGCDPGVAYCPNGLVTREEMASFLARTAGLGGNPPIARALSAVSAMNATQLNGQPASFYQAAGQIAANATHATTADNAANAAQLGGQPASAYLSTTGDTTFRYAGATAYGSTPFGGPTLTRDASGAVIVVPSGAINGITIPLPAPTSLFGLALAAKAVRVCYSGSSVDTYITGIQLWAGELGTTDASLLLANQVKRVGGGPAVCVDLPVATPTIAVGQIYLNISMGTIEYNQTITIYSVALTVAPLGGGTP